MRRFKGLDFIRFYAALSVIVYHVINDPAAWFGHPSPLVWVQVFFLYGGDAVTCFFVLSGFLITYLLLNEQRRTRDIALKAFYVRRALRIWPLYFLVVALGYLAIPLLFPNAPGQPPTGAMNVLPFLLLLPNFIASPTWQYVIAHLWSIGIEELFYACYPVLMRCVKSLPILLLSVIALRWLFLQSALANGNPRWIAFAVNARFDCMAMGGLGAYLAFKQHFLLRVLYHPLVQLCAIGIFVLFFVYNNFDANYDLLKASVFMVYILNVATNPRALLCIDFRGGSTLGNLSYPMYMLHPFVLYVLAWLLPISAEWALMLGTIALTLVAAAASYRWFEAPFLRLKTRRLTVMAPVLAIANDRQA